MMSPGTYVSFELKNKTINELEKEKKRLKKRIKEITNSQLNESSSIIIHPSPETKKNMYIQYINEIDKKIQWKKILTDVNQVKIVLSNYVYLITPNEIKYQKVVEDTLTDIHKADISNSDFEFFVDNAFERLYSWQDKYFDESKADIISWNIDLALENGDIKRFVGNGKYPYDWSDFYNDFFLFAERSDVQAHDIAIMKSAIYYTLATQKEESWKISYCRDLIESTDFQQKIEQLPLQHPSRINFNYTKTLNNNLYKKAIIETIHILDTFIKTNFDESFEILSAIDSEIDVDNVVNRIIENYKLFIEKQKNKNREKEENNIAVVPTMKDEITDNAAWCATFKLVWNDFQYDILQNNFVCDGKNEIIDNLSSDMLDKDILSEKDYYKVVGKTTLELKEKIENELLSRFNEKSDILGSVEFVENEQDANLLLYTMLKKDFAFAHEFLNLGNSKFGKYENEIEFFGISKYNSAIKKVLSEQVNVLFYNNENDFSVMLNTKSEDSIILYRTNNNDNFENTFNELLEKASNNKDSDFKDQDTLKIPNLSFNVLRQYMEIAGKTFTRNSDNMPYLIAKAIQTIEFELDKTGARVKSEALMEAVEGCVFNPNQEIVQPRDFNFDDTFYLFLIESGKEKPYLAIRVQDIENFII